MQMHTTRQKLMRSSPRVPSVITTQISTLSRYRVKRPLNVIIEDDGPSVLARTVDLPLYGVGDDWREALNLLKSDLEDLYEELLAADNLSPEWQRYRLFLMESLEQS
jgi:hypothetical protein